MMDVRPPALHEKNGDRDADAEAIDHDEGLV